MSLSFIVTTSVSAHPESIETALAYASEIGIRYIARNKRGIDAVLLEANADAALVVKSNTLTLNDGVVEYQHHPNMLLVRGINVIRNMRDLFLEAAALRPGERVLDCTVGFGCEASLAALNVGETGSVDALESEPALALVTRRGLAEGRLETKVLASAMKRVNLITADYEDYLSAPNVPPYDVIYFDPFFRHCLRGSEVNIDPLARFGNPKPLSERAVLNALKLTRRSVIVKHPDYAQLPPALTEKRIRLIVSRKGKAAYSVLSA